MKVFISQPMNGKTDEQIREERRIVEIRLHRKLNEKFEILDTVFDLDEGTHPLVYLGKSIEDFLLEHSNTGMVGISSHEMDHLWKCTGFSSISIIFFTINGFSLYDNVLFVETEGREFSENSVKVNKEEVVDEGIGIKEGITVSSTGDTVFISFTAITFISFLLSILLIVLLISITFISLTISFSIGKPKIGISKSIIHTTIAYHLHVTFRWTKKQNDIILTKSNYTPFNNTSYQTCNWYENNIK